MAFNANALESYMITGESSSSGFLGVLSRIPSEETITQNMLEVQQEIVVLESYTDAIMGQLFSPIAMESSGEVDNASRIAAKARMAREKIKEGKQNGNQNMINQGVNELSSSMQELSNESKKAKDPKSKARLWMVAKTVGAIIASVLLLLGAVTAGKALTAKIHANGEAQRKAINEYKDAKISEMRRQADAEIQQIQRESEERSKKLDQLINDMKANLNTVNQMRDQVNKGKSGQFGSSLRNVTVKMPDGTTKQMTFDEAMKSNGTLVI